MPATFKKLEWDKADERFYEAGVDRVVLFPLKDDGTYDTGVAWSGVTNITEKPTGAEPNDFYADNLLYASIRSAEKLEGTIEAYTYPDEFAECDGSKELVTGTGVYAKQQKRRGFGLAYRSFIGNNDNNMPEDSYMLHIIYGATASPSERAHETINEDVDLEPLSWDFSCVPIKPDPEGKELKAFKNLSSIDIDVRKLTTEQKEAIEKKLYGETTVAAVAASGSTPAVEAVAGSASTMPTPMDLKSILTPSGS